MPDVFTKAKRSEVMAAVRSRGNKDTELKLVSILRARRITGWRRHQRLPGQPDFVFPREHLALFVDGCFWHGCPKHLRMPRSNEEYWRQKITRNNRRDKKVTKALRRKGWRVLRIWGHELKKESSVVQRILKNLSSSVAINKSFTQSLSVRNHFQPEPQKTFDEFFAGVGLMRMALEREGWRIAFANDIDPEKQEMYRANFPEVEDHFVLGNVHDLLSSEVPTAMLATASFPCNDLSLAGARKGLCGKQSSAFWGFIDLLEGMAHRRPTLVLLENVPGFLTSHAGKDFEDAMMALNRLGYSVDPFMLDAARFVPQSRLRLFVVGVRESRYQGEQLEEKFFQSEVRPGVLADFIFSHAAIRWKLRTLPSPPRTKKQLIDIIEDLPTNSAEWWSPDRSVYLLNQMSPRHRILADSMISGNTWSYGTVFRRIRNEKSMAELRTDGIAGCLRTPRGGSGRQILFKAGKGQYFARLLTPRECARLMGADDFKITVPVNQALFGFGDAVCVPVVEWIARNYLNPLVDELFQSRGSGQGMKPNGVTRY